MAYTDTKSYSLFFQKSNLPGGHIFLFANSSNPMPEGAPSSGWAQELRFEVEYGPSSPGCPDWVISELKESSSSFWVCVLRSEKRKVVTKEMKYKLHLRSVSGREWKQMNELWVSCGQWSFLIQLDIYRQLKTDLTLTTCAVMKQRRGKEEGKGCREKKRIILEARWLFAELGGPLWRLGICPGCG